MNIQLGLGALAACSGLLLLTPSARGQATGLVFDGDTITGVGVVDALNNLSVNTAGDWLVEGSTDNPVTSDDAFVTSSSSGLLWQEGQSLPTPGLPGSMLGSFDSVRLNNDGDTAWNFFLDPTTTGVDSAVFYNSTFVLQEGDDSSALTGAPVGSPWLGFLEVRLNDLDQIMILATINDMSVGTGNVDAVLTRVQLDAAGAIVSATPILREDDVLPGMTGLSAVDNVESGADDMAFNNNGDAMFVVDISDETNGDKAVYTWIGGTFTMLAEEGTPTPFDASRNYDFLTRGVDLNDNNDTVFKGNLSGDTLTDEVIMLNGSLYRQEGDSLPAIAPFAFEGTNAFGGSSGPVLLDQAGNVLWWGDWNDPNTDVDSGLFLNDDLLLQEGVSTVDGIVIDTFAISQDGLSWSDDGRYIVFEARLVDGRDVVAILDLQEAPQAFCFGDGGVSTGCTDCPCGNNAASGSNGGCLNSSGTSAQLLPSGSPSVGMDTLRFEVSGANASTFGILQSADNQLPNMGACPVGSGITSPVLDGLRCVGGNALRHGTRASDVNGDIGVTTAGWGPPNGPPGGLIGSSGFVAGQTRHFQCFYREGAMVGCGTGQNTTNAISVTFQ